MTDEEIKKMREKHNKIFEEFEEMLKDPKLQEEIRQFVKISGTLTAEELYRKFTI